MKISKLIIALTFLVVLNFLDLVFTIFMFENHWIVEANPLMNIFLCFSPLSFALVKLALCYMGVYILYKYREKPISLHASCFLVVAYIGVLFRHAYIFLII